MPIRIVISVTKVELAKHEDLGECLSLLSTQIKELPTACLYFPSKKKLKHIIDLLDALNVNYIIEKSSVSNTFGVNN
jgi:hypothetical protein